MIDRQKAGMDPRIFAALLFLGGSCLLMFTLAMNYKFAQTVALTEGGQMLRAYTSLAMDAFGSLVLMSAAGFALAAKQRLLSGFTFLCALMFLSYSAWNVAGFGATERLGAQQHRDKIERATAQRRKEAMELRKSQAEWLRGQSVDQKGVDSKRLYVNESNAQIDKALSDPIAIDKELPPDAQATFASEISGKGADWFQKADVIALAVLLIMGKAIGFGLAPLYLPRKESVAKPATPPATAQEVAPNVPFVKARTVTTAEQSGPDKRLQGVARFFAEWTRPATGASIGADSLLASYNQFARLNGLAELKQNGFGRLVLLLNEQGKLAMSRRNGGQGIVYMGFELVPSKERATVGTVKQAA